MNPILRKFLCLTSSLTFAGCNLDDNQIKGYLGGNQTSEAISLSLSYLTIDSSTVITGLYREIVLYLFNGDNEPIADFTLSNIQFSLSDGTTDGLFYTVKNLGNGQYKVRFKATTPGSQSTVVVTINGKSLTSTLPVLTAYSPRLNFTGANVPSNPISTRTFDESTTTWNVSGECDNELGPVTIYGGIDIDTETDCVSGSFSLTVNYDTTSPMFVSDVPSIFIKQRGIPPKSTNLYKTLSTNPLTVISSAAQLAAVTLNDSTANYVIDSDIDIASEFGATDNWTPVGTSALPFRGVVHGDGHTISNLNITTGGPYKGLFGYLHGAVISGIKLQNVSINLSSPGSSIGGIAGYMRTGTKIIDCHVSGSIAGQNGVIGGLVGNVLTGTIESSSFAGTITAGTDIAGGLAGRGPMKISNSFSNATINGQNQLGGIVGVYEGNGGTISSSYATVNINGSGSQVGGLIGEIIDNSFTTPLENTWATGTITGVSEVGGLVGEVNISVNDNGLGLSYSSVNVTGCTTNCGGSVGLDSTSLIAPDIFYASSSTCDNCSAGVGVSKTDSELKSQSTFSGWDFNSIWLINDGESFPTLN